MSSTKVLLGGVVAVVLVVSVMAADDKTCDYGSQTGKQDCNVELLKDQALKVTCGATQSVFEPTDAFSGADKEVCDKSLTTLSASCGTSIKLNTAVPGINYSGDRATTFTVKNTKEMDADKTVYAICKNSGGTNGFIITVKFKKGGSSDASSRGAIPAIILGSLATLVAFLRA